MNKQTGFTLIELAIVLVIIGLLLGGVLRGQELINSAKVKNMATDFRGVPVFIYGYQDKFRRLPGDDASADANVGVTAAEVGDGNGSIGGAWDSTTVGDESVKFWLHIRKAGLAPGGVNTGVSSFFPTNSEGGRIGVSSVSPITNLAGQYYMCSESINGKFAKQLDVTMDDGTSVDGSMRAFDQAVGGPAAAAAYVDANTYTVCMAF
ncbi:MAG: prepilin-type N-terminal cleavage/methylation domain-containing protein [Methylophilaceae bacterium]